MQSSEEIDGNFYNFVFNLIDEWLTLILLWLILIASSSLQVDFERNYLHCIKQFWFHAVNQWKNHKINSLSAAIFKFLAFFCRIWLKTSLKSNESSQFGERMKMSEMKQLSFLIRIHSSASNRTMEVSSIRFSLDHVVQGAETNLKLFMLRKAADKTFRYTCRNVNICFIVFGEFLIR